MAGEKEDVLVEIDGLVINFYTYQGVVQAIEGVDLVIRRNETLGLVGETGCGKSVTASAIMGLVLSPPGKMEAGSIYFMEPSEVRDKRIFYKKQGQSWYNGLTADERRKLVARFGLRFTGFKKRPKPMPNSEVGKIRPPDSAPSKLIDSYMRSLVPKTSKTDKVSQEALSRTYDLLSKSPRYMQKIRGKYISMIFQEPTSALNPVFTAGNQIAEVILQHRKVEMADRVLKRLDKEAKLLKKSKSEWDKEAKTWYAALPQTERQEVLVAVSGRPIFKARAALETESLTVGPRAPDSIPPKALVWYTSSRQRPRKVRPLKPPEKDGSDQGFVCSSCGTKMDETDERCLFCDMDHYGRISWMLRPLVMQTYKRIMQSIKKNPDGKQGLISRVPILRRYKKELEKEAFREAVRMLETVRIPDPQGVAARYPYELSGGMQQRVMIAIALACNPRLLIADEPTTALDVTIQGQILKLMRDLKSQYGSSILLITHNLGVVAEMCDRVGVMYAGSMAEIGTTRDIFKDPLHPYTKGLMRSVPSIQMEAERLYTIRGSVPNLIYPPNGCRFHPRCDFSRSYCTKVRPPLTEIQPGHSVACHMAAKAEGYVHGE